MATIRHLLDPTDQNKTLCGRPRTYRTNLTTPEQLEMFNPRWDRLCMRCRSRAEREGIIRPEGVNADGSVDHEKVSSGDKQHDDWLSRLGVS